MREVNNFLKKRAAAADGGESAIAPGGGPKVGKDVLSAVPPKFPKSMGVDQDGNDFGEQSHVFAHWRGGGRMEASRRTRKKGGRGGGDEMNARERLIVTEFEFELS